MVNRGVATEKILGGHLNIGGAQSGYFRNFGRFYGFFIAISEYIGGARAPPRPPSNYALGGQSALTNILKKHA